MSDTSDLRDIPVTRYESGVLKKSVLIFENTISRWCSSDNVNE